MKNSRLLSLALSAAGVLAAASLLLGASGFAGGRDLPLPTTARPMNKIPTTPAIVTAAREARWRMAERIAPIAMKTYATRNPYVAIVPLRL